MFTDLSWTDFKILITNKGKLRFQEQELFYTCTYEDFRCSVLKDSGSEQSDFETNFKPLANKIVISQLEITKQPDPSPFAQPLYRTKRSATANVLQVEPNTNGEVVYVLAQERYVSGGCLIVYDAQPGDYITAEVEDTDGIIPAAYRAALCEAHPIVATYIEKEWVQANPNGVTVHEINTHPLNAKITAGLYLCLHYHAVDAGVARKIYVNYYLTKKL